LFFHSATAFFLYYKNIKFQRNFKASYQAFKAKDKLGKRVQSVAKRQKVKSNFRFESSKILNIQKAIQNHITYPKVAQQMGRLYDFV